MMTRTTKKAMMTKEQALMAFATAIVREILREEPNADDVIPATARQTAPDEGPPMPRFDFDESADDFCEHGGMRIPRAQCPVHGPDAETTVSAEELDDLTNETHEEANPLIARARRLAEQQRRQQGSERLFPEDMPNLKGMGPPEELPPNLVV
jgi:hypothetical protein